MSEILRIFRDEKPPQFSGTSAQALTASRWVPPSTLKRDANHDDRNDFTFRRVRGLVYIRLYYIANLRFQSDKMSTLIWGLIFHLLVHLINIKV